MRFFLIRMCIIKAFSQFFKQKGTLCKSFLQYFNYRISILYSPSDFPMLGNRAWWLECHGIFFHSFSHSLANAPTLSFASMPGVFCLRLCGVPHTRNTCHAADKFSDKGSRYCYTDRAYLKYKVQISSSI